MNINPPQERRLDFSVSFSVYFLLTAGRDWKSSYLSLEPVLAPAIASVRVMDRGPAVLQSFLTAKKTLGQWPGPEILLTLTHTRKQMKGRAFS